MEMNELKEYIQNEVQRKMQEQFSSQNKVDETFRGSLAGLGTGVAGVAAAIATLTAGAATLISGGAGAGLGMMAAGGGMFIGSLGLASAVRKKVDRSIINGIDADLLRITKNRDAIIAKLSGEDDQQVRDVLTRKLEKLTKEMRDKGSKLHKALVSHKDDLLLKLSNKEYEEALAVAEAAKSGMLTDVKELVGKTISGR